MEDSDVMYVFSLKGRLKKVKIKMFNVNINVPGRFMRALSGERLHPLSIHFFAFFRNEKRLVNVFPRPPFSIASSRSLFAIFSEKSCSENGELEEKIQRGKVRER